MLHRYTARGRYSGPGGLKFRKGQEVLVAPGSEKDRLLAKLPVMRGPVAVLDPNEKQEAAAASELHAQVADAARVAADWKSKAQALASTTADLKLTLETTETELEAMRSSRDRLAEEIRKLRTEGQSIAQQLESAGQVQSEQAAALERARARIEELQTTNGELLKRVSKLRAADKESASRNSASKDSAPKDSKAGTKRKRKSRSSK